jgi:hypothetical protein
MKDRPFPSVDRVLVGAFAALIVARPLVDAADPGRLRLTTSTGPLSFNLLLFVLLAIVAVRRAVFGGPRLGRSALVPLMLLGVAVVSIVGTSIGDRYARPGLFIAWEWTALAAAFVLARILTPSAEDARGIRNVLIASVVSIAGLGIYQVVAEYTGLPLADPPTTSPQDLAGDSGFHAESNRPVRPPTGTLDSPDTFGVLCMLGVVGLSGIRSPIGARTRRILIGLLLLAWVLAIVAVFQLRREAGFLDLHSALNVLRDSPVLGTGVGNWARVTGAPAEPPMAWVALASTAGVLGLALVLGSLVLSIGMLLKRPLPEAWLVVGAGPRWEFHLGGITGLILGFVWAAGAIPAEAPTNEVFRLATTALLRAAVWIAVFSALESARLPAAVSEFTGWSFGLVAFGLVAAGPCRFTVLLPTFVFLGLALNLRPGRAEATPARPAAFMSIGLALIALTLAIGHLATAAVPAWSTASAVRQARLASRLYPDLERQIEQASPGGPQTTARTKARAFLIGNILNPLEEATARDPKNSALWLELVRWRRALWKLQLYLDPEGKIPGRIANETLAAADRAAELDPRNLDPLRSKFESLLLFRRMADRRPKEGGPDERLEKLRQAVADIAAREPAAEIGLRTRIVDLLLTRREFVPAGNEIVTILQLNRAEGSPHGRLTEDQIADLLARVRQVGMIPPQELLDEVKKE